VKRAELALLGAVLLVFLVLIPIRTWSHGDDFEVFWRASRSLLAGEPIYSVALFGNMVFKYPPWILPVFLPFAALPLAAAKIAYGLVQSASLVYVARWLLQRRVSPGMLAGLLVAFGGVILVHANVGQVTLPLLAVALGLQNVYIARESGWKLSALTWALSAKLFTAFPLLGLDWSKRALWKGALITTFALVLLSLPVIALSYGFDVIGTAKAWVEAMFSGTQLIAGKRIGFTTRECQGFPGLLLRLLPLNEENRVHVMAATLVPVVAMFAGWKYAITRLRLSREDQWLGWLALMPVVQPLAWFHFFWFVFPVAALAMARGDRRTRMVAAIGVLLVAAVTEKTLGSVGSALEMASIKSWGTLVCLGSYLCGRMGRR